MTHEEYVKEVEERHAAIASKNKHICYCYACAIEIMPEQLADGSCSYNTEDGWLYYCEMCSNEEAEPPKQRITPFFIVVAVLASWVLVAMLLVSIFGNRHVP